MAAFQEYALLCLENPLLDEAMLEKYGLKPNDAILAEEKHMGLYEDLLQNHNAKLIAGGAAQNTARGAQYILPPKSTLYIGCVGQDKYAQILRERNDAAGLRAEYLTSTTHPTGRCGVIITGQDRSMCTDLAAANEYKIDHLKSPEIWKLVQQAKVYYVGGYHLTVCVPAILALAEEAAKEDKVFIMSLSAPFIPLFFKDQLAQTSKYWDYVIGNETEARSWAEGQGHQTRDVKEIALMMAGLPKENSKRKRTVIITQGTEATVVAVQGEKSVKEFGIKEIGKEEICDTNGAGYPFPKRTYQSTSR
ncbi:adenosine kinase, partial [Lecanoromycetidae sp. Uapishka_2]